MLLPLLLLLAAPIDSDEAAAALCAKYENYQVAIPDGYSEEEALELGEAFANGNGAKRDFDAAIHFLCKANVAPAELWGMLDHVEQMRRGETDDPLDFCAHVTSGNGSYICSLRRETDLAPELASRYETVRKDAGKTGKALDALRERATAFIEAESHWLTEQTRGGTIYNSVAVGTKLDGEEMFVEALERYSRERAPSATAADEKRADAQLNAAYRKSLSEIEPCPPEHDWCPDEGEPTETDNLRNAQRAWIRYRDAFIAWYIERWRGAAPAETLRREILTQLTRDRTGGIENPNL